MNVLEADRSSVSSETLKRIGRIWEQTAQGIARVLAPGVVAATTLSLFLYQIGKPSLWYDETWSLALARISISAFWKEQHTNMLLYYPILAGWLNFLHGFGIPTSATAVRLPSALAMTAAAVVVFYTGRRFWDGRVGLVGAVLFALNTVVLGEAQAARAYAFQLLFCSLAWLFFLHAVDEPHRWRWWVLDSVCLLLGIYMQITTGWVVAAQIAALAVLILHAVTRRVSELLGLAESGPKSFVWPALFLITTCGLGLFVWARISVDHHGSIDFVHPARLSDIWALVLSMTGGSTDASILLVAAATTGAVVGLRQRFGFSVVILASIVIPLAGAFLVTQPYLNLHLFYPRYLLPVAAPLALLTGVGLVSSRPRWLAAGAIVAVAVVIVPPALNSYGSEEKQPFGEITSWMDARFQAGDGLICRPSGKSCGVPMGEYVENVSPDHGLMPPVFPGEYIFGTFRSTPTTDTALKVYLLSRARVFVVTVADIGGDPDSIIDSVPGFLTAKGYRVTASYRPATLGDRGDVSIALYTRASNRRRSPLPGALAG